MYRVGDKAFILNVDKIENAKVLGFENGVEYEVVKIYENNTPVLIHNKDNKELCFFERELKYIRKVEKLGVTEVKKKITLEVGDKLVYIGGENIGGDIYTDDQEYEVVSVAGTTACVTNNNGAHVWWDDFTLNYNFKKAEKKMYKVNDKVVILDASKIEYAERKGFKSGGTYKVHEVRANKPIVLNEENGATLPFYRHELEYIKKVEETMYKKGDKLLRTGGGNQFYKKGKVYEVIHVASGNISRQVVSLKNEVCTGSFTAEEIEQFFELVTDDIIYPYNPGDKIVFTDIDKVWGAEPGDLTVGKVYEVMFWKEAYGGSAEHFVIKNNNNKDFIIRYDEYEYVKKVSELERKKYIRVGKSSEYFNQGMTYEAVLIGDLIIFCLNDKKKRQQIYHKTNIAKYFEEVVETVGVSGNKDWSKQCDILTKDLYNELVNELDRKDKEIEELKHVIKMLQPLPMMDVNQERAIVIHRAKKFVSEHLNDDSFDYDMIYTESRRMVTVLLKHKGSKVIHSKGQSICAKGDVFNLYIGRAIALGRALGIDVSYFEDAVQPELAIGQIVKTKNNYAKLWRTSKVVSREHCRKEGKRLADDEEYFYCLFGYDMTTSEKKVQIINDTDAEY